MASEKLTRYEAWQIAERVEEWKGDSGEEYVRVSELNIWIEKARFNARALDRSGVGVLDDLRALLAPDEGKGERRG